MPNIVSVATAEFDINRLTDPALMILETLTQADLQAYVVGGGVRDILLGRTPKDFDIVTDAEPEQVLRLFRRAGLRAFIVGRRFRLVHVHYQRDIIEVSTFRAVLPKHMHAVPLKERDENQYGLQHEDAARRDFSINALYYDHSKQIILDYGQGLNDLKQRQLRVIGHPIKRLQEDPGRILRAIRLSCKLKFNLDKPLQEAITKCLPLLTEVPPARLYDEFLKMLASGVSLPIWQNWHKIKATQILFPTCWDLDKNSALIESAFEKTDTRIAQGKNFHPAFLVAVLAWPLFSEQATDDTLLEADKISIAKEILNDHRLAVKVPKRIQQMIWECWCLQYRLLFPSNPKKVAPCLIHPRFRMAFDLLALRAEKEDNLKAAAAWWNDIQTLSLEKQAERITKLPRDKTKPRRRRIKKAAITPTVSSSDPDGIAQSG